MVQKDIQRFARRSIAFTTIASFMVSGLASADTNFTFVNHLAVGFRGIEIQNLQIFLRDQNVYNGPVTGYFGPLTEAGVKNFQTKYGIDAIGEVGPITRSKLNELASNSSSILSKIQNLQQQVDDLRAQLAAMKNAPSASTSGMQALQDQINNLQAKLNSLTFGGQSGGQPSLPTNPSFVPGEIPSGLTPGSIPSIPPSSIPPNAIPQQYQDQITLLQNLQSQLSTNPNMSIQDIQSISNQLNQIEGQMATSLPSSTAPLQGSLGSLQSIQDQLTANPNMSLQDIQTLMNQLNSLSGQLPTSTTP